jgi:hypothetical protein
MKIRISKTGDTFEVDPFELPGSPYVGRGRTMDAAMGDFMRLYQDRLDLKIEVHESAQPAEMRRRQRELSKR